MRNESSSCDGPVALVSNVSVSIASPRGRVEGERHGDLVAGGDDGAQHKATDAEAVPADGKRDAVEDQRLVAAVDDADRDAHDLTAEPVRGDRAERNLLERRLAGIGQQRELRSLGVHWHAEEGVGNAAGSAWRKL
jgi:hypothetical protein